MRALNSFFDEKKFLEGKRVIAVAPPTPWYSKDGNLVLGSTIKLEIDVDNTDYGREGVTNEGEQFSVKSSKPLSEYAWIKRHTPVKVVSVTQAIVYGEFNNGLSLRGDVTPIKE